MAPDAHPPTDASRESSERPATGIGRVRVRRGSEIFADELRDRILGGAIRPGALLPAERELAEESGLSRATVREALGVLAVEGLVHAKIGRGGGYVVQQPPREAVVRFMDVFIRGRGLRATSLIEVRDVLEPHCASLAATRRTDQQLERLRSLTAEMAELVEDTPAFLDRNVSWHVAVAEASDNDILAAILSAIAPNIRAAIDVEAYDSAASLRAAHHLHERIVAAIADGDAELAGRLMRRHIHAATAALQLPCP